MESGTVGTPVRVVHGLCNCMHRRHMIRVGDIHTWKSQQHDFRVLEYWRLEYCCIAGL